MSHYVHSGLSPREEFNINGRLSRQTVEQMLDDRESINLEDVGTQVDEAVTGVKEASGCFPAEDFLCDLISDLQALQKNLRGNNRSVMDGILMQVEQLATETFQTTEYGRDELEKSVKTLNKISVELNS